MGEPAQGCFQTAQNDRQIRIGLLCQPGINGRAPVGACAGFAAGRIFVLGTRNFRDRIMAHHAVNIAAADEKAVFRLAEPLEILAVGITGLRQHADFIALGLEQAADDGGAKAGMVDVSVAAHDHKIQLIPAPGLHVRPADGKKFGVGLLFHIISLIKLLF